MTLSQGVHLWDAAACRVRLHLGTCGHIHDQLHPPAHEHCPVTAVTAPFSKSGNIQVEYFGFSSPMRILTPICDPTLECFNPLPES
jgi:hypothetical protein